MKNTKFDAPNEYAIFLQEVIEVVRSLSVDDFDRKPHDLVVNGVIKIIDFPFFSWSEKLKNDFISATTEKLKEKNYSIDFLKELKEQFAYELQRNEMKMGTDVFDNNNYSDIFFIIWRSENINGVRKQMSRKALIYIDETIKKLEQTEPAQPEPTVNVEKWNDDQESERLAEKQEQLSDLITHTKGVEIVEGIKIQYKNIKGKRLKLLLLALQELSLLPKTGIASKFHRCCEREFDWNIASLTALNSYKYNERTDNDELTEMKRCITSIIETN